MGTYQTLKTIGMSSAILVTGAVFTVPAAAKDTSAVVTQPVASDTFELTEEQKEAAKMYKEYKARQKKNSTLGGDMVRSDAKNGATGNCVVVATQGNVEKVMAPPMPSATADQMVLAMKGPLKPKKLCGSAGVALWNASINGSK